MNRRFLYANPRSVLYDTKISAFFFTFEGPEGAGKTTQIHKIATLLEQKNIKFTLAQDPGGTHIGKIIKNIILNKKNQRYSWQTEILLYATSRAQLVHEIILPALKKGHVVICDRFLDSNIVYQALAASRCTKPILDIHNFASSSLLPCRTYLLDLPISFLRSRLLKRGHNFDWIEEQDDNFHISVINGYRQLANQEHERFLTIDATWDEDDICRLIMNDLKRYLSLED